MTFRKQAGRHAVFKLEPGEYFEAYHKKYMIVLDYDPDKDYTSLDGDIYTTSYGDAQAKAASWN